jgi:hypothetical protein
MKNFFNKLNEWEEAAPDWLPLGMIFRFVGFFITLVIFLGLMKALNLVI